MQKRRFIAVCAILFGVAPFSIFNAHFSTLRAETDNTGGVWTEVGASKALPYNLSLDASAGYRTIDWFDWSSRWDAGAGLGYKVNKYLKLGLGYTFIAKHNQEETKEHYKSTTGAWNGQNVDAANWAQRHRLALDITGGIKFRKTYRLTLRERYQYTHQMARDVDRTKYRDPNFDGDGRLTGFDETTNTVDHKSAKNRHVLRSRLKLSIDRKKWRWEPYASVEVHNNLAEGMHLDKLRTALGTDYSITKHHRIGVAYVFNHENDDDGDQNIHAISIGYNYKF